MRVRFLLRSSAISCYNMLRRQCMPVCSGRGYRHAPEEDTCMLRKRMPACSGRGCLHAPEEDACMLRKRMPACTSSSCRQVPLKCHYVFLMNPVSACFGKFLFRGVGEFTGEDLVQDGLFEFCQGVEFFLVDGFEVLGFGYQSIKLLGKTLLFRGGWKRNLKRFDKR